MSINIEISALKFVKAINQLRERQRLFDLFSITNPRFQTLLGQVIYSRNDIPASLQGVASLPADSNAVGEPLNDGTPRDYRDPDGTAPAWAAWEIVDLFHSTAVQPPNSFGLARFGEQRVTPGAPP